MNDEVRFILGTMCAISGVLIYIATYVNEVQMFGTFLIVGGTILLMIGDKYRGE